MHIRLLAVGDRQPSWVGTAFDEYAARLPRQWQFHADAIPTADRRKPDAVETEGSKLISRLKPAERLILLDEKGKQYSSREVADQLERWQSEGDDVVFVIGGPDGVSGEIRRRAAVTWSLSKLTLPHGLARILFVEQLYRAWSLTTGHPYHRD